MIKPVELYHGVVLERLVQYGDTTPVAVATYPTPSRCSYVVNNSIGIYVKHSKARITPWGFSFLKKHQDEIQRMVEELGQVFVVLVCGRDGLACLSYQELKEILDHDHDPIEWIRVSRRLRHSYQVSGSDGKLKHKVSDSHFPGRIFE